MFDKNPVAKQIQGPSEIIPQAGIMKNHSENHKWMADKNGGFPKSQSPSNYLRNATFAPHTFVATCLLFIKGDGFPSATYISCVPPGPENLLETISHERADYVPSLIQ
jgi:hypothetical protein